MILRHELKRIRVEKNISQPELAKLTRVCIPTIVDFERGKRDTGYMVVERILEALDVELEIKEK